MKRILSVLLAALMLLPLAACGGSGDDDAAEITTAATAGVTTTAEDTYVYDGLPENNYDGARMHILTTTWYQAKTYIYAESLNGEVINDALYEQRSVISDRFNVAIDLTSNDAQNIVASNVDKMVLAGDDTYDMVFNHDLLTVGNALRGDFINILNINNIDFGKPWWKGSTDTFTVNGKLLFTANHFALSGIYMNYMLAYNKDIAAAHNIEIPYDDVRAGEWYLEDLIGLTADIVSDIDGDGVMTDKDMYGFLTSYYGDMGMQSDLGGTVISKDGDGYLVFEYDLDRIVAIMEAVERLYENGTNKYGASNEYGADLFMRNQGLFTFSEARVLYEKVRTSDVVYGIMPFPKFDELQEEYRSSGCDIYWGILVPAAGRAEMIATLAVAMSCYNYNNVVPKVWELVLGSKLSDSPDDTDMFEIIRDVQYVDLGYAFSGESSRLTQLCFLLQNANSGNAASYIEARAALADDLDKINRKFDEVVG